MGASGAAYPVQIPFICKHTGALSPMRVRKPGGRWLVALPKESSSREGIGAFEHLPGIPQLIPHTADSDS
jgi:hypothetical protein